MNDFDDPLPTFTGPEDSVKFYTRPKVVTSRWPYLASSEIDLGFPKNR